MPSKLDTVSLFSPGNCSPELLESMLVGQNRLVDKLEKAVLDSIRTEAGHNWLLVGPRGTGKTHLLAVLYNRVNANPDFRDRLAIAYLKEEERGVASFLDWLVRILKALERHKERPALSQQDLSLEKELTRLTRMPIQDAQNTAERILLDFVGERRLLLIAENLGEIFSDTKGMGKGGQRRFRDLVQQHPFWIIMASTQALFKDIQTQQAPFYGFFRIQHLRRFTFEEAVELLEKLVGSEEREQLGKSFRSEVGRGRIRAIHEITGGNPRLLVIFYQFLDRESIEDLARPFLEMVDNLTSYYQEQMQPLPALQQKIVEFLSERRVPQSVKEIAQSCFITHQTASSQLKRLKERRFVKANPVGRNTYYELQEPLFRICFEVKENRGYAIRLFIDFLGRFYSMEELKRKHRAAELLLSIYRSRGMLREAKRHQMELTHIDGALSQYHPTVLAEPDSRYGGAAVPDLEDISSTTDQLLSSEDADAAESSYLRALELDGTNMKALMGLGRIYGNRGDSAQAQSYFLKAIEHAPREAEAWRLLGLAQIRAEDIEGARISFQKATDLDPQDPDAWLSRGRFEGNQGDHAAALKYLKKAESLELTSAYIQNSIGEQLRKTGLYEEAIDRYLKAVELDPDDCYARFNIALALFQSGDLRAGMEQMARTLEAGADRYWADPARMCINEMNFELLRHGPFDGLTDLLKKEWDLFKDGPFRESFTEGIIGALTGLLKDHRGIPLERLVYLRDRVLSEISQEAAFSVVCRLFTIGVRYIETKHTEVLLELPLEERSLLESLLEDQEQAGSD